MKFTRESTEGINLVRAYTSRDITVQNQVMGTSFILAPTQIVQDWRPRTVGELKIQDFDVVLELEPEIILLGTGAMLEFPDRTIMSNMLEHGIGFEVMDTGAACRTYNILVQEDRAVVAALLIP